MFKNKILFISLLLSLVFILIGTIFTDWLSETASFLLDLTLTYFGSFYILSVSLFVIFCLYLMFSKYGKIRLGKDSDKPEFSTVSWISMLYSAGMGIGLLYWAVAEPVKHYLSPPIESVSKASSASADLAMTYTYYHWGIHPWALYGVVGLGLAYFQFRKGLPVLISSIFHPLLGDKIYGPIGRSIDIFSIFLTMIGIAQGLGLSALQAADGFQNVFGITNTVSVQITIVCVATLLFILSSLTGLSGGIKFLSNANMWLSIALMTIIIFAGPTKLIIDNFINSTGSYFAELLNMSFRLSPFNEAEQKWLNGWTIFYWAWWITWAPFVGTFVSRISKGRTIKEFIAGVILVPLAFTFLWFSTFGGSAIHFIDLGNTALKNIINTDVTSSLFAFLELFPMGFVLSLIALLLTMTFYISSADSGVFVLAMFSSGGNLSPSNKIKVMWGVIVAFTAIVFLLAGGLEAVQTICIVLSTPFAILMLFMCFGILKGLRTESKLNEENSLSTLLREEKILPHKKRLRS